jgi:glycerol-3-phosphate dehydrogenase
MASARGTANLKGPFVIQDNLNRVIFVIPQSDKILVGTTEVKHDKDLLINKLLFEEIEYLMVNLKKYFPTFSMDRSLIISSFGRSSSTGARKVRAD